MGKEGNGHDGLAQTHPDEALETTTSVFLKERFQRKARKAIESGALQMGDAVTITSYLQGLAGLAGIDYRRL